MSVRVVAAWQWLVGKLVRWFRLLRLALLWLLFYLCFWKVAGVL
jgi:hypothetical protein